jgi:hypothetical protein
MIYKFSIKESWMFPMITDSYWTDVNSLRQYIIAKSNNNPKILDTFFMHPIDTNQKLVYNDYYIGQEILDYIEEQ